MSDVKTGTSNSASAVHGRHRLIKGSIREDHNYCYPFSPSSDISPLVPALISILNSIAMLSAIGLSVDTPSVLQRLLFPIRVHMPQSQDISLEKIVLAVLFHHGLEHNGFFYL